MPLLSIITVCKNPGKLIHSTVESIKSQNFENFEYIVVDSLSTDGTREYLLKIKEEENIIDKLIIENDNGIYDAINKGIHLSSGDYIGLCHAGDYYKTNILSELVPYFDSKNDIIYGSCEVIFKNFKKEIKINKNAHKFLNSKMSIMHPATFVSKTVYEKIGNYSQKFKISSDFDFFKRASKINCKYFNVERVISIITYGGISTQFRSIATISLELSKILFGDSVSLKKFFFIIRTVVRSSLYSVKIKFIELKYFIKDKIFYDLL